MGRWAGSGARVTSRRSRVEAARVAPAAVFRESGPPGLQACAKVRLRRRRCVDAPLARALPRSSRQATLTFASRAEAHIFTSPRRKLDQGMLFFWFCFFFACRSPYVRRRRLESATGPGFVVHLAGFWGHFNWKNNVTNQNPLR